MRAHSCPVPGVFSTSKGRLRLRLTRVPELCEQRRPTWGHLKLQSACGIVDERQIAGKCGDTTELFEEFGIVCTYALFWYRSVTENLFNKLPERVGMPARTCPRVSLESRSTALQLETGQQGEMTQELSSNRLQLCASSPLSDVSVSCSKTLRVLFRNCTSNGSQACEPSVAAVATTSRCRSPLTPPFRAGTDRSR